MFQPSLIWAQTNASYAPATRIDESTLSSIIASPSVQSFDLSPDGKTVALLVATGFKAQAPLWLVTEEIAIKRFTAPRQIGHLTILNSNFSPQVRYTSDQQHLVVQDFQTIRVFDSKSFEPVRTISSPSNGASLIPLFITGARNKDVFVCAFGSEQNLSPRFHTTAVQVEVVDTSSGAVLGQRGRVGGMDDFVDLQDGGRSYAGCEGFDGDGDGVDLVTGAGLLRGGDGTRYLARSAQSKRPSKTSE